MNNNHHLRHHYQSQSTTSTTNKLYELIRRHSFVMVFRIFLFFRSFNMNMSHIHKRNSECTQYTPRLHYHTLNKRAFAKMIRAGRSIGWLGGLGGRWECWAATNGQMNERKCDNRKWCCCCCSFAGAVDSSVFVTSLLLLLLLFLRLKSSPKVAKRTYSNILNNG